MKSLTKSNVSTAMDKPKRKPGPKPKDAVKKRLGNFYQGRVWMVFGIEMPSLPPHSEWQRYPSDVEVEAYAREGAKRGFQRGMELDWATTAVFKQFDPAKVCERYGMYVAAVHQIMIFFFKNASEQDVRRLKLKARELYEENKGRKEDA